jgi:hypothetical protein
MPKDSEYFREILERVRLAGQLDNHLSSDQLENVLNGIEQQVKASLEQLRKKALFWIVVVSSSLFIIGLAAGILLFYLLWPKVAPCSFERGPTIIIYAPDSNTNVLLGGPIAILSKFKGIESQVTWKVTCSKGKDCGVLAQPTGDDNFFTAPNTPDDTVTVWATVTDKCGREDRASLLFKVGDSK